MMNHNVMMVCMFIPTPVGFYSAWPDFPFVAKFYNYLFSIVYSLSALNNLGVARLQNWGCSVTLCRRTVGEQSESSRRAVGEQSVSSLQPLSSRRAVELCRRANILKTAVVVLFLVSKNNLHQSHFSGFQKYAMRWK